MIRKSRTICKLQCRIAISATIFNPAIIVKNDCKITVNCNAIFTLLERNAFKIFSQHCRSRTLAEFNLLASQFLLIPLDDFKHFFKAERILIKRADFNPDIAAFERNTPVLFHGFFHPCGHGSPR